MKNLFTVFFLLLTIGLFAQPVNDDCDGLIHLGIAPSCDSTLYNNVGATPSDIGLDNIPTCWANGPQRDVWIAFEASDTINDYLLTVTGCPDPDLGLDAMLQPQIAVYRGDCEFDGLQLLDCASADPGSSLVELELIGLTPGLDYFIRIQDWSASATPNEGAFKFCVIEKPPINNICAGSSALSSGTLTDSGGPDGDYGNDENCVYTICPSNPHECLTFNLQYYNIENNADILNFYDGDDNSGAPILSLSGQGGLNSGGVCQTITATSGCMTVEFITSSTTTFEGFLGTWETSSDECPPNDLIVVDDSPSEADIVESVIEGNSLISVTDIDCPNGAMGIFEAGDNTDLGLERGMVLTTGSAIGAANPASTFISEQNFANGDDDLDALSLNYSNGSLSQDACIVEMDVFANSDKITFEYIFGSEEYPVFVNSTFNDIFGLLASGPGIVGDPFINNQQNVGVLGDGTFVEINTVNYENNWQFYRDNTNGQSVVYGGLTSDSLGVKKSLTATVPTIPCETYHLKFAIADRGDQSYDSGVFIAKINSGVPEIGVNFLSGIEYLAENCTPMPEQLVISFIGEDISQPVTYNLEIAGTAELGVDYTLDIPSTVTFETGSEEFIFDITPIQDGIAEGPETIIINITQDFGCGETVLGSVEIDLFDDLEVQILEDVPDTVIICESGTGHQMMVSGAEEYMWEPAAIFSDPTSPNPIATPTVSQWVTVTGTTDICSDVDSVFLSVINPEISVLPGNVVQLCEGDSITLEAVNNVNNSNLEWQSFFFFNFDDPNAPIQTVVPDDFLNNITITVGVELDGCVAEEVVNIFVDIVDEPQLVNDTTICQNYSVDLGEDITFTATLYNWTPDTALEPGGNVSGPIATPDETTTYTLISSGALGECFDTSSVTITVIPADVEIQNPDTTFICLGESVDLVANTSTNGVGLTWTPDFFLTPVNAETVSVNPPQTTWYFSTLEATAECTVFDSVLVWVDSLPVDLSIMADPMKDSYCEGEEVTLISPTYEPANFPAIDFTWLDPMPGSQTPDSFLNMVILAVEDNVFIRETTVNACRSIDSIFIDVVRVSDLSVEPAESIICPGESVQLTAIPAEEGEISDFMWSPASGLSCTDCQNPIASPSATITYQVEAEFDGCPVGASATVTLPSDLFNGSDGTICPGDSYALNNVNVPGATFVWTPATDLSDPTAANPIATPTSTTTYQLVATIGDCTVEESVTVFVAEPFTISLEAPDDACPGDRVVLTITPSTDNPLNYTWTDGDGNVLQQDNSNTYVWEPASSTMTFNVTASDNCFSDETGTTIQVSPPIDVLDLFITAEGDTIVEIFEGQEIVMDATVFPYPVPNAFYNWFINGDTVSTTRDTLSDLIFAPEVNGDVESFARVNVTDEFGCTFQTAIDFLLRDNPVRIPNVFTPNGDAVNDLFNPVSFVPVTISEFQVWNRWGQLVYDNETPDVGWDGTQDGEPALSDVYVYKIVWEITGGSGTRITEKGDVTLLR